LIAARNTALNAAGRDRIAAHGRLHHLIAALYAAHRTLNALHHGSHHTERRRHCSSSPNAVGHCSNHHAQHSLASLLNVAHIIYLAQHQHLNPAHIVASTQLASQHIATIILALSPLTSQHTVATILASSQLTSYFIAAYITPYHSKHRRSIMHPSWSQHSKHHTLSPLTSLLHRVAITLSSWLTS
jgi:hypothetical protein